MTDTLSKPKPQELRPVIGRTRRPMPGDIALPAVGRSENLNILPGGFFDALLSQREPETTR